MNKRITLIIVLISLSAALRAQVVLKIVPQINIDNVVYIKCYGRNFTDLCDAKTPSIIEKGKINECFQYLKTLKYVSAQSVIDVLRAKKSYSIQKYPCFTTDYALVFFNLRKEIIGYLNFSFICSRYYGIPEIQELKNASTGDIDMVGITPQAKRRLIKILNFRSPFQKN